MQVKFQWSNHTIAILLLNWSWKTCRMLAKSPFQLRSLLCIHVCQGLLCWKRQEKLWPEFSLGNCQDGRTARGQQQKKFFRRTWAKPPEASEGRGGGISVLKTLPRTKVDSIKGLSETPCKMESSSRHLLWLLKPQKQSKGRHVSHFGELSTLMHYSKSRQTFPSLHRITIN